VLIYKMSWGGGQNHDISSARGGVSPRERERV
jgi:hypothetical protein